MSTKVAAAQIAETWEAEAADAPLPRIHAGNENLPEIAAKAWNALRAANDPPIVFRVGGVPARIETDDDGAPVTKTLTKDRMRHRLARVADFYRLRKRDREVVEVAALPPEALVNDMLAQPNPDLPTLTRIVEAPVVARSGAVLTSAGYHPETLTYYAPAPGFSVPDVALTPTATDIKTARSLLCEELLGDFPFESNADLAHALALLLLPFARELIDGPTPLHLFEKPAPGTGASLCTEVLLFPALGRAIAAMTEAGNEDEWRKRLTARLVTVPSAVLIDNLRARLDSAALSAAITASTWEDRLLGASEMIRATVRCAWIATGNNPALSNEIARRTIRIRLDAKVDRPWERRDFRHADLRQWAREHRGRLVWAALTLTRAWIAKGRPTPVKTLGNFEQWATVVGGILSIASVPGFLTNLEKLYEEADAEGATWRAFVGMWWDRYQGTDRGVGDLWKLIEGDESGAIDLPLGKGNDRSQKTKFGLLLATQRDRQYGDLRIVAAGKQNRAQLWRLEQRQ